MSSEAHRNALMEVLDALNIPKNTTCEPLAALIEKIVEANKISSHDNEFLAKGFVTKKRFTFQSNVSIRL